MAARASKRRAYGTGGRVRQLSSGRWQARFRGPDGVLRPAPETFETKSDANGWCDRQAELVAHGKWKVDNSGTYRGMTFEVYARRWLEGRDLKPRTRSDYRRYLESSILPHWGDFRLTSISPDLVRGWYEALDASKPTARARVYGCFRSILSTAYEDDLIKSNPCRIRRGTVAKRRKIIRPLHPEQIAALAVAVPDRYRLMIMLAGYCGIRSGELRELRRRDVHLEDEQIRIERSVAHVDGEFLVGDPKSEAGVRDAQLPDVLIPHVEAHLQRFVDEDPDALLFPARHGGHMAESSLYRVFYPARDKIGRPDLRFHDLRHTAAVLAASRGATIAELQQWLGHASPQAAMIYQHSKDDSKVRIAAGLSEVAASTLPEPISSRKTKRLRA